SVSWVINGPPRCCIASTIDARQHLLQAGYRRRFRKGNSALLQPPRPIGLNWIQRWIECDSFGHAASRRRCELLPPSNHPELKDYSVIAPSPLCMVRKLLYGSEH